MHTKRIVTIIRSDKVTYDMNKGHMVATVKTGQVRTMLMPDQLEDKDKKKSKENKDQKQMKEPENKGQTKTKK